MSRRSAGRHPVDVEGVGTKGGLELNLAITVTLPRGQKGVVGGGDGRRRFACINNVFAASLAPQSFLWVGTSAWKSLCENTTDAESGVRPPPPLKFLTLFQTCLFLHIKWTSLMSISISPPSQSLKFSTIKMHYYKDHHLRLFPYKWRI